MEKVCEFCTALSPLVYCNPDAAYLCLSCDAKVHWANELSGRHLRTLVCNSCRYHLAYVQCLDHKMLICQECDQKLHQTSSPHRKRAVRTFLGCPSAKEFAKLWCFELTEIENSVNQEKVATGSSVSANLNVAQASRKPGIKTRKSSMVSGAKFDRGSSSQQGQKLYSDQERQTILQQIVDLKRFQLSEEVDHSTKVTGLQGKDSVYHTHAKVDEKFSQQAQSSQHLATYLLQEDGSIGELSPGAFSAFSQLDKVSSSSVTDLPLHGELFWTCKSPFQSNQLWSQNIQDLGICEELISVDDFNIPDVDLTFQNFDELFGGDQDPIRVMFGEKDVSCSSLEKDISVDKSDIDNPSAMEDAFVTISQSGHENKDMNAPRQYCPRSIGHAHEIQPFESTVSFSVSRFSGESSHTDHDDSAVSPYIEGKGYSLN